MRVLEQYSLSEKYTIYKTKYTGKFTKADFLKRSSQNEALYFYKSFKTENSLDIEIQCKEFHSVDNQVLDILTNNLNLKIERVAKSSWIYIQVPEFNMHWMHTHEYLESSNRTNLRTQWTYVFYIQIPEGMVEGDGNLIFETEDKKRHTFIPEELDILIFPGDLPHIAMPSQSGKIDRIVYAGNINYNFSERNKFNQRIKFEEYI